MTKNPKILLWIPVIINVILFFIPCQHISNYISKWPVNLIPDSNSNGLHDIVFYLTLLETATCLAAFFLWQRIPSKTTLCFALLASALLFDLIITFKPLYPDYGTQILMKVNAVVVVLKIISAVTYFLLQSLLRKAEN